jgi:branched-chain amino acid transport system ATP-binding protein
MGIGRGFQLTNLFPHLSVLENVRLAAQSKANKGFRLLSIWSDHAELIERAEGYLEQVSLYHRRHEQTAILSHGDKRKLEVALMLALEPEILMFDEPTAGMSVDEVPVIINLIQKIKQDQQKTVLLVEHKMDVVRSLADRIMVLQDGCLVADGEPNAVMASDAVQQAYLGKKTSSPKKMENNPISRTIKSECDHA